MKWIKTSELLPERKENTRYSQVPCLVVRNGEITILVFNHEHECWDQEDGDDYCCDIFDIKYWQPLPEYPCEK